MATKMRSCEGSVLKKIADEDRMEAEPQFEQCSDSFGENVSSAYKTPLMDHKG